MLVRVCNENSYNDDILENSQSFAVENVENLTGSLARAKTQHIDLYTVYAHSLLHIYTYDYFYKRAQSMCVCVPCIFLPLYSALKDV